MKQPEFKSFPKIPRLRRTIVVTEKIDGTNAQIHITADGDVFAGSRNRWITPEADNFGFARWAESNKNELLKLGPGTHFGEWWGLGIQRGYDLSHRVFSLFNTAKWSTDESTRPSVCGVVPVLYCGEYSDVAIQDCLDALRKTGSATSEATGFNRPEGVVVYMQASGTMHKVLLEGDELPKGFLVRAEREREAAMKLGI